MSKALLGMNSAAVKLLTATYNNSVLVNIDTVAPELNNQSEKLILVEKF